MKKSGLIVLALCGGVAISGFVLSGCTKKQEALEEMQQPMSPEDLSRIVNQTVTEPNQAQPTTQVSGSEESKEVLPPSGPYNPSNKDIQTALKAAGVYEGKVDGNIGPMTKRAIEKFQTANGLKADGKVGPKTWTALSKYLTDDLMSSVSGLEGSADKQ